MKNAEGVGQNGAVLPEGVGKKQSKAQRGKSKNPLFSKFFCFFNCNDLAKT